MYFTTHDLQEKELEVYFEVTTIPSLLVRSLGDEVGVYIEYYVECQILVDYKSVSRGCKEVVEAYGSGDWGFEISIWT